MRLPGPLLRLASPALAAYGLKALNAVAAFIATALIARIAGPAVVGDYGLAVLTASMLGLIAMRGLDQISLRQIAGDLRIGDTAAARGILNWSRRTGAVSTVIITLAFAAALAAGPLARLLAIDPEALAATALGIGSFAFYRLGLCVVRGAGRPIAGQFFEGFNSLIFALLVSLLWWQALPITALGAVLLFFACQIVSVVIMWSVIARVSQSWAAATLPDTKALTRAGLPIMAVQSMHMFSDWLLLALIAGAATSADVGAMRVAMQIVLIIALVVSTGETYIAARIAGDLRAGRPDLIWARHRRATIAMALLIGPLIAVCILLPGPLLGLAFGPGFVVAAPALAIMALGQGTKILTGPIGGLLTMTGLENRLFIISITGLAILVGLAVILIPQWGLAGAAAAHAATISYRNIASYIIARRHIPQHAPA